MTVRQTEEGTWYLNGTNNGERAGREGFVAVEECKYHPGQILLMVGDGTGAPAQGVNLDFEGVKELINVLVIEHEKQMAGWSDRTPPPTEKT